MAYPRRLLVEGEQVVVELRPHWSTVTRQGVAAIVAVGVAIGVVVSFPHAPVAVGYLLLAAVVLAGLWLAGALFRRAATRFVLTSTRIIERTGMLARRSLEIRLDRVNELASHQSILGRILGEGQLEVEVGGETGVVVFEHLPRPDVLRTLITEQISAYRHRGVGPEPSSPDPYLEEPTTDPGPRSPRRPTRSSVTDDLVALDELRRRGIVTDAEFQAKKTELLDRL